MAIPLQMERDIPKQLVAAIPKSAYEKTCSPSAHMKE